MGQCWDGAGGGGGALLKQTGALQPQEPRSLAAVQGVGVPKQAWASHMWDQCGGVGSPPYLNQSCSEPHSWEKVSRACLLLGGLGDGWGKRFTCEANPAWWTLP